MKILTIENFDHLEERFSTYLEKQPGEKIVEFNFNRKTQEEALAILTQPGIDELCLESLFQDRNQMIKIMGALVKFKDRISFRTISILYSANDFEIFLNRLIQKDAALYTKILEDLFDIYEIYAIEHREYEDVREKGEHFKPLFRKSIFMHDRIRIEKGKYSDGSIYFTLERNPVIDPRGETRSHRLYSFNESIVNDKSFQEFFEELQGLLEWQEGLIEDHPGDPDHEELKAANRRNQIYLDYIKTSLKCPL